MACKRIQAFIHSSRQTRGNSSAPGRASRHAGGLDNQDGSHHLLDDEVYSTETGHDNIDGDDDGFQMLTATNHGDNIVVQSLGW